MKTDVEIITEAAKGLIYISETDAPFYIAELSAVKNIEQSLLELCAKKEGEPVEKISLEHFFSNMIKTNEGDTGSKKQAAVRFKNLAEILNQKLTDIAVYRIGTIAIDAIITGHLRNGNLLTLKTNLVET